jgi:hypothetical protein
VVPALQAKGTRKEKMKGGFLRVRVADEAIIVISFKLMLFPS